MSGTLFSYLVNFKNAPIAKNSRTAAIIATGPSFVDIPLSFIGHHVHIIAVKEAIFHLPRANSWITVDANRRCRTTQMALHLRKPGTQYYAAVPRDYGLPNAVREAHRLPPEPFIHYLERIDGSGLSENRSQIVTGNSAFAALGLAYHMGFSRIGIFGVDATQDRYGTGYSGRPRGDLAKLHDLFASAVPQLENRGIQIKNSGRLRTWPTERAGGIIEWLNAG